VLLSQQLLKLRVVAEDFSRGRGRQVVAVTLIQRALEEVNRLVGVARVGFLRSQGGDTGGGVEGDAVLGLSHQAPLDVLLASAKRPCRASRTARKRRASTKPG